MRASNVSCTDSESMSKTRGNTLLVLLLYNVSYRVSYRDNCIGIRIGIVEKCIIAGLLLCAYVLIKKIAHCAITYTSLVRRPYMYEAYRQANFTIVLNGVSLQQ